MIINRRGKMDSTRKLDLSKKLGGDWRELRRDKRTNRKMRVKNVAIISDRKEKVIVAWECDQVRLTLIKSTVNNIARNGQIL